MDKYIANQTVVLEQLYKAIKNSKKDSKTRKTATYINLRIKTLNDLNKEFKETHRKILDRMTGTEEELKKPYFKYSEFEEQYLDFMAELEEMVKELNPPNTKEEKDKTKCNSEIKLPRIVLPNFNGDYESWISFRDLFVSLIDENASLSNVQKLHYLKSSLTSEAEVLLRQFSITDANYTVAWKILKDRYENKRILVNAQFKKLLGQSSANESSSSIKRLLDTTVETVQAIENLRIKDTWNAILVHLTVQKLPAETRQLWEQNLATEKELPSFDDLKGFLETRFRALEAVGIEKPKTFKSPATHARYSNTSKSMQSFHTDHGQVCLMCTGSHNIRQCPKFLNSNHDTRFEYVKRNGLCLNCLGKGHLVSRCPSKIACSQCRRRHHFLLHKNEKAQADNEQGRPFPENINAARFQPSGSNTQSTNINSLNAIFNKEILLATALVTLEAPNGNSGVFRALLDQGSQATFITEAAVQRLGLKKEYVTANILGIGKSNAGVANGKVKAKLKVTPTESLDIEAFILTTLANFLPSKAIMSSNWIHLKNLTLADPTFNQPGRIDLLLGADVYANIILEGIRRSPTGPIAQNTRLGWIISGTTNSSDIESQYQAFTTRVEIKEQQSISEQLQKFWEIEEVPFRRLPTKEEEACEKFFVETIKRTQTGRYTTRLPFKDVEHKQSLGKSKSSAVAGLLQLERRFERDSGLKQNYTKCINEYIELGHMHLAPNKGRTPFHKGMENLYAPVIFCHITRFSKRAAPQNYASYSTLQGRRVQVSLSMTH